MWSWVIRWGWGREVLSVSLVCDCRVSFILITFITNERYNESRCKHLNTYVVKTNQVQLIHAQNIHFLNNQSICLSSYITFTVERYIIDKWAQDHYKTFTGIHLTHRITYNTYILHARSRSPPVSRVFVLVTCSFSFINFVPNMEPACVNECGCACAMWSPYMDELIPNITTCIVPFWRGWSRVGQAGVGIESWMIWLWVLTATEILPKATAYLEWLWSVIFVSSYHQSFPDIFIAIAFVAGHWTR